MRRWIFIVVRNRDINDPRLINSSQEIDDPNDPEYVPLDDAGGQIYSGFILNPYLKVFYDDIYYTRGASHCEDAHFVLNFLL